MAGLGGYMRDTSGRRLDSFKVRGADEIGRRDFPTTWEVTGEGVLTQPSSGMQTIYWPEILPAYRYLTNPPSRYFGYCSTDHSGAGGGIGVYGFDEIGDPWLPIPGRSNPAFTDTTSGTDQTETPTVRWNPHIGKFTMWYQQRLTSPVIEQATLFATSDDGLNFTKAGRAFKRPATSDTIPGGAHQGYARVHPRGGGFGAFHLQGGGDYSRGGYSISADGVTWKTSLRTMGAIRSHGVPGRDDEYVHWIGLSVVEWHGQLWGIGTLRPSGTPIAAPLRPDYLGFSGPGQILTIGGSTTRPLLSVFVDDGDLYGCLETGEGNTRTFSTAKAVLS